MPPERKRMAGLWEREVGGLPPRHFANAVMASKVPPPPSSLIT
jgi:WD repeat-containing protein 42A